MSTTAGSFLASVWINGRISKACDWRLAGLESLQTEAFNGRCRAECLNENWFIDLADAKEKAQVWRMYYNANRSPCVLGNLAR